MHLTSDTGGTIETGMQALASLIKRMQSQHLEWSEADTRFQFIDPFLIECLGWSRDEIRVETRFDNTYTDYELGVPRMMIVEAKREGVYFELPANPSQRPIASLKSIMALDHKADAAIRQVQEYCSSRGTQVALVCNGHQLIAFLASRLDGNAPLEGKCLVVNGYDSLPKHFPLLWQNLSRDGIRERYIVRLLTTGIASGIPKKVSSYLLYYPSYRYKSEIQSSLRTVAELLIEDVVRSDEIEAQFYKECYCESGALARDALINKQILAARYAALFQPTEAAPKVSSVAPEKGETALTPDILAEAISHRPIVLIGDVGVGKTSFLKHLMHISALEEFQRGVYVYIDLGSQAALEFDIKQFVLNEIERQLGDRYGIDVNEAKFVRGIYNKEVTSFRAGIYGALYDSSREEYEKRLLEFLEKKIENKAEHLRYAIAHIVDGRKKQVILMLDNADQRNLEVQQEAFLIGQNLSQHWKSLVFITVRPQTFHQSKRAGTFSAYPQKAFSISPPRADMVVKKRLTFALDMAEGRLPIERLKGVQLNYRSLALFLKALLHSMKYNKDLVELLSNITGGNIRAVIDLVIKFIGSPNVDADKIISIMQEQSSYRIPVHEFSKSALLGEYSHYSPESSIAMNLFDVRFPDVREHFLVPLVIGYLNYDGPHRNREGFVTSGDILAEMQSWGFTQQQTESALRRTTNKRLIETTERVTFDEDITGLIGDMPAAFRITTVGAYHLLKWAPTFAYLDAMAFDTPIFDSATSEDLVRDAESFDIRERYRRTVEFRKYLNTAWHDSNLAPPYFDWLGLLPIGQASFDSVKRFVNRYERQ